MEHSIQKDVSNKLGKWRGRVTFTRFAIKTKEAEEIDTFLKGAIDIPEDVFLGKVNRLKQICTIEEKTYENMIVATGRACFAGRLAGDTTYTGIVNYGALGTASDVVADGNTRLAAEVSRKGVATRSQTGTTATLRFFYSKSDTNGTYEEFGTFIDGTASADTGQMFNRVLTGGWTKTSLESLTVTVQFDLNAA